MVFRLVCHPDFPTPAVHAVRVGVRHEKDGDLRLRYAVKADRNTLIIPEERFPGRTDGLWQSTCFELFIRPEGQTSYYEFNFSPSTEWAAYGFSGYRAGMSEINAIMRPRISVREKEDAIEVTVMLSPGLLATRPDWNVGFSAVLEEANGRKSYWALQHPAGAPDFHHRDCFAARLSPTVTP